MACIEASPGYLTAREIACRTGLDYKSTIDALNALHNRERIARSGRKFSAVWGSRALLPPSTGWESLAGAWFGRAWTATTGGEAERGRGGLTHSHIGITPKNFLEN